MLLLSSIARRALRSTNSYILVTISQTFSKFLARHCETKNWGFLSPQFGIKNWRPVCSSSLNRFPISSCLRDTNTVPSYQRLFHTTYQAFNKNKSGSDNDPSLAWKKDGKVYNKGTL